MPTTRPTFGSNKVASITVTFWTLKLLTTGVGESASDYLASLNVPLAGAVGGVGFAAALTWQLRTRCFRPLPYWAAVLMIAVFGTMLADGLHVVIGVPYPVTSIGYAVAVLAVLFSWYRSEKTVSMHDITTRRREIFYWCTVAATFALGTAVGDLTALTLHLGYAASIGVFAAAIAAVVWAWRSGLNPVVSFWATYVLTRPLGASIADWVGKPRRLGGLDAGDGWVALAGMIIIACAVALLAKMTPEIGPSESTSEVTSEQSIVPSAADT